MPLGNRGSMHPDFFAYGRPVMRGTMQAFVRVLRQRPSQSTPDTNWNPVSSDASKWTNASPFDRVPVYQGMARVTPNINWRARKGVGVGEILTDHAVDIEIDFTGNKLNAGNFPIIEPGFLVFVDSLIDNGHGQSSEAITRFSYTVRNVAESSTSWVKSLLCDITMQQMTTDPPPEDPVL